MGKRSNFKRVERDFYPTPKAAVLPLLEHLPEWFNYVEPCAGDGRLIQHLTELTNGVCKMATDIEPKGSSILKEDARTIKWEVLNKTTYCITNPPWDREILHPIIENFIASGKSWLLFDADWMHTKQATPFLRYCSRIVSVGRVKWIEDSTSTGKDNCAWYLFDQKNKTPTEFYGRT
tara:strand:- start:287 stop:817 length:531 start_codon:yes stop_codon:yes gene_type:complete